MLNTGGFNWTSHARTDVGKVRKINEDSVLDHANAGIWVVADGMGGHAAGDIASAAITDALAEIKASADANELINTTENKLLEVNENLIQRAKEYTNHQMIGSTVAVLIAFHSRCFTLWAGDSRIYRARNGQLTSMTKDHCKVEELVDDNLLTEEEAEKYPETNIITRAIGANNNLYLDIDMHDVKTGDRYMICSDGLYKEVTKEEIADLVNQGSPEDACNRLIDLALERGSRDNVTVIVIQADKACPQNTG